MKISKITDPNNPKISPRYRASDYRSLNLHADKNDNWEKATDIFYDRINGRFLAPVDAIVNHKSYKISEFSGFSILAIDCLIIETLNQFYKGTDETRGKNSIAFSDFFRNSRHFMNEFRTENMCEIFYGHFRCGLLHQAQTKEQSKIRYGEKRMIQLADESDVEKGLIVDRKLFHKAIKLEIKDYIERLKKPKSKHDKMLRCNFIKKMDFITKV
jgi:hypothetical protein